MIEIDGHNLSIDQILAVAEKGEKVILSSTAKENISKSHHWVEEIVQEGEPVYGINTGFGIFADKQISEEDINTLNRNLILSHAVSTGPDLDNNIVRAAMLIRANTLACGYSGIRLRLVENLLGMLNEGITPKIPSQGSLGSSGDLSPLAHLALVLTTDKEDQEEESGFAEYDGKLLSGKSAMHKAGINREILGPKEGLAITNGATFSAGIAALVTHQGKLLLGAAENALAMSLEALLGATAAFDDRLNQIRKQAGQILVAENVRKLTEGSTLTNASGRVQDAYSLRCAPQVQGSARDTLSFVENIVTNEINAVTDNPLLFGPKEALSGGNFHGEPIAMVMDFIKIAFSEVAAISERRTFHLTDGNMNAGLPAMLVDSSDSAGLNSGVMMLQYTAASLVLENLSLASPDSIHSLPTSGGKEDHNANAMTAARNAYQLLQNCAHVIAIELYCAAKAIDLRLRQMPDGILGKGVAAAQQIIRGKIPNRDQDSIIAPDIETIRELILQGKFTL